jgi:hypothetical protein
MHLSLLKFQRGVAAKPAVVVGEEALKSPNRCVSVDELLLS